MEVLIQSHKGHLTISKIALKKIKLDKVYWLVTKKNPFKKKSIFPLKHRLISKKDTKISKKIQVLY